MIIKRIIRLLKVQSYILAAALLNFLVSCNFLEVGLPENLISSDVVFSSDEMATAAAKGMYANFWTYPAFSGGPESIVSLAGLSADELHNYPNEEEYLVFERNALLVNDPKVLGLWTAMYKSIYDANLVMKGLNESTEVTQATKNQLYGEALFVRAFSYFYLVNFFGDVPLITTTDYRVNATAERTDDDLVYDKIIEDLVQASDLLSTSYAGTGRVRPNKAAAYAMLARVYLFTEDWERAEANAAKIIENTTDYELINNLNSVFLSSSREAIWQLALMSGATIPTGEGNQFIIENSGDLDYSILRPGFINTFETNDKRLINWIGSFDTGVGTVYYSYKYKLKYKTQPVPSESPMVLRLAEQHLIRAEARLMRDDLAGAIVDIDEVRERAGLPLIAVTNPSISKDNLKLAIEHERQVELFTEWGHRWFDLIRTDRADAVLSVLKPVTWNPEDVLYPIPQSELNKNPKLKPQNPGYN